MILRKQRNTGQTDIASSLTLTDTLGAFRHKQGSTLVAEKATIFSIFRFFVNI